MKLFKMMALLRLLLLIAALAGGNVLVAHANSTHSTAAFRNEKEDADDEDEDEDEGEEDDDN